MSVETRTFLEDTWIYVRRMRLFAAADWGVYFMWGNLKPPGGRGGTARGAAGPGDDTVYGASRGGRNRIKGGPGNDYLQGGGVVSTNFINAGSGFDTIRLVGDGYNGVLAGPGDDIVYAYSKDRVRIDCGPGRDTVKIGYNRNVRTKRCETVTRRYKD